MRTLALILTLVLAITLQPPAAASGPPAGAHIWFECEGLAPLVTRCDSPTFYTPATYNFYVETCSPLDAGACVPFTGVLRFSNVLATRTVTCEARYIAGEYYAGTTCSFGWEGELTFIVNVNPLVNQAAPVGNFHVWLANR